MATVSFKRCSQSETEVEENTKKPKLEEKKANQSVNERNNFDGAYFVDILNDNRTQKTIFLHGKFKDDPDNDAVIILEKKPFDPNPSAIGRILSDETKLEIDLRNDIYATYSAQLPSELNDSKATVIYPATKKHLEKYRSQKFVVVTETKDDYNNITKPFLERQFENNMFSIQWVYNILDHKKEEERIIYEDPDPETGFILLPDMKWDVKDSKSLYVIAIPHKRGIKSLRDLTHEHVRLLKNLEKKCFDIIKKKFDVGKESLRMYLHYQPSYYHLHVHINNVVLDMPGTGCLRAHLLSDVIQNLEMSSNYYKEKSISFMLKENDKLLHELLATNCAK